jgi:phosphoribosylglycinamide formyltransferase-1
MKILVLVSGSGTNLQALLDAESTGRFKSNSINYSGIGIDGDNAGHIVAVISDRAGIYALERAKKAGIPAFIEEPDKNLNKDKRREDLSDRILKIAREYRTELIILAGFLSILQGKILVEFADSIINLHPSLLPKYGGEGMYGSKVHEAVLAAGEKESGCSVHLVDAGTDTGTVLLQRKIPVLESDTAESLAWRIHREEHNAIVEAAILMMGKENNNEKKSVNQCL